MIDLSPEAFRKLGYQAVDLLADQLANLNSVPTRQAVPEIIREKLLHQPLPETGCDPTEVLRLFAEEVLPYPMGNNSPRFLSWINPPPAPIGVLAELLAAGMNPSVAGGDHAATYVEHAVLGWIKTIMGYPLNAGGVLVSGGSVANIVALAVMRHVRTKGAIRTEGFNKHNAPLVVYTSTQGHGCIQKAVELLGMGSSYLRKIPVDAEYRMDVEALRKQIAADRAAGLTPAAVAASAGTVNTGALDPFDAIADVCEAEDLWFHVDGSYGAVGILVEEIADLYKGIERSDSLALDPHKWLYVPVECGCVLVKDAQAMRDSFSLVPPYLRDDAAIPWFSEYSIQQTRGFKALKLWMMMQQIGVEGYRELLSHDIAMAKALRAKIAARPDFELVAGGPLSVTCFRYTPAGATDLASLNRKLVDGVARSGKAFITSTELRDMLVLRACVVNFRTTETDLDTLLEAVASAGQAVLASA